MTCHLSVRAPGGAYARAARPGSCPIAAGSREADAAAYQGPVAPKRVIRFWARAGRVVKAAGRNARDTRPGPRKLHKSAYVAPRLALAPTGSRSRAQPSKIGPTPTSERGPQCRPRRPAHQLARL